MNLKYITVLAILLIGFGNQIALSELIPLTIGNENLPMLTIWVTYNTSEFMIFRELCREFEREKNVKLKIELIPWDGHQNKLRLACTTHTTPDIARVDIGFLPRLALGNALIDLNKFNVGNIKKDYVQAAYSANVIMNPKTGYSGVYGLPDQTTCVALYYNKEHFKEVGLVYKSKKQLLKDIKELRVPADTNLGDARPPHTWQEFLEYAKKLTVDKNNDGKVDRFGFAMNNSLWWTFPFFNSFGAKFLSEDGRQCILNNSYAVAALQFKVDLYRKYKVEAGAWRPGATDPDTGFMNNKYSMILSGPWNIKRFREAGINYGITFIPAGPCGTSTNIGGTSMVIFKTCKNPKLAFEFLRFVTGAQFQVKWCRVLGQIPVNLKAFNKVFKNVPFELKLFMEQIKYALPRPKIPKYDKLEEYINREMESALTGQKSVKQALNDAVLIINKEVMSILTE